MVNLLLDCVPDDLCVDQDDDGFVVSTPVSECDQTGAFMTLDCRLDRMPSGDMDTYEFSFGFTIFDLDGGTPPYLTQDRYDVVRYLNGHSSQFVMPTVCVSIEALVWHASPNFIFRVTKKYDLPQKAFYKHELITATFNGLGFSEAETGTDGFGRTFWLMAR